MNVSIVEHGDTAFLGPRSDICVERKNLKEVGFELVTLWMDLSESRVMTGKNAIT